MFKINKSISFFAPDTTTKDEKIVLLNMDKNLAIKFHQKSLHRDNKKQKTATTWKCLIM